MKEPGKNLSEEISDFISDADVIVADITEKNPNVYYELGYLHASSKKALLLIEDIPNQKLDIPFDIRDFRCHSYTFSKDGFEKIKKTVSQVLTNILVDKIKSPKTFRKMLSQQETP